MTSEVKKRFTTTIPIVWEFYSNLNNERKRLEDKLNYLLAFNTFFVLFYLDLFKEQLSANPTFYLPLIPALFSIFYMLYKLFGKLSFQPWINEKNKLIELVKEGKFEIEALTKIYVCASDTYSYQEDKKQTIALAASCMTIGFFLLIGLFILNSPLALDKLFLLVVVASIIVVVILIFGYFIYLKLRFPKCYNENHKKDLEETRRIFGELLNGKS